MISTTITSSPKFTILSLPGTSLEPRRFIQETERTAEGLDGPRTPLCPETPHAPEQGHSSVPLRNSVEDCNCALVRRSSGAPDGLSPGYEELVQKGSFYPAKSRLLGEDQSGDAKRRGLDGSLGSPHG